MGLQRHAQALPGAPDEQPHAVGEHAERVDEADGVDVPVGRDLLQQVEVLDESGPRGVDREERDLEAELVGERRRLDRGVDRALDRPAVRLLDRGGATGISITTPVTPQSAARLTSSTMRLNA